MIKRCAFVMVAAALSVAACGSDDDAGGGAGSTTGADQAGESTGAPGTTGAAPAETFALVRTTVVGAAVGGSSGGESPENTDPLSEAVRNPDGTCVGWDGPGGRWTQGLESGAPVVFLALDEDVQIGTGTLGTSEWIDVSGGDEEWNCVFPFTGEIDGAPERFRVKVGDLEPWAVYPDPTRPGEWISSVNSFADPKLVSQCADPPTDLITPSDWGTVVGQYWSDAFASLCFAGFKVAKVQRPCRPPDVASDRVMKVTNLDESVVYEDESGNLLVDPTQLPLGTELTVYVAIGRPCG
jgi:hypothetical protein